jgi:hypothetical protein
MSATRQVRLYRIPISGIRPTAAARHLCLVRSKRGQYAFETRIRVARTTPAISIERAHEIALAAASR